MSPTTSSAPLRGIILDDSVFAPIMGSPVGTGSSRVVLTYEGYPELVVKACYRHVPSANWVEWNLWNQIKDEERLTQVFGECFAMSANGRFLVMERLNDLNEEQERARKIPPWVTDRKLSAFGANRNGEIKLRDYGQLKLGFFLSQFQMEKAPR